MTDALAEIASTSPRDHVVTLSRDDVQPDDVQRYSVPSEHVARDNVVTSGTTTTADGFKIRRRVEKPHASIYAHPKVFKAIREIAAAEGRKPHDLFTDGSRLVLKGYGRDFDKLNRGE